MNTEVVKSQKPEDRELNKKLAELRILEEELTERELELTNLSLEMRDFEAKYLRIVGLRFARLDELEVIIAETYARLNPTDNTATEKVTEARKRAQESAKATSDVSETLLKDKFKPSENIKKLYRTLAKYIHPDLCTDEKERLYREKLMREANRAYEEGDEEELRKILQEWQTSPESIKGIDIGAELIRVLRKIAQVEERLNHISLEIQIMQKSDLYQMKIKVEEAAVENIDLLGEMATRLNEEIVIAETKLNKMLRKKYHG